MKPNVIVALLVGLVLGIALGYVMGGPSSGGAVAAAGAGSTDESRFQWKSSDMPAGTFTGMSATQKHAVMKVMNENPCTCGCDKGTLANCVKTDPNCPNSPAKLRQAVELARAGKTADQIQREMFGAGGAAQAQKPGQRPPPAIAETVFKVPIDASPIHGNKDALVTMVEYSDYQCPYCSRADATVKQLEAQYGDKLRVVMKQLPLDSIHPHARPAALAALAAGQQGKYWEMHDLLFRNQSRLDEESLQGYAKELGLDFARWERDRKDPKLAKQVQDEVSIATGLGITGTPGFFINGRKIPGALPLDVFQKIIDEEYAKAQALVAQGVPAGQVYAKIMEKGVTAPPPPPAQYARAEAPADSPSFGPKTAKVTIVEWSDFECPYCSRVVPTLQEIKKAYPNDVRIVFRHQPLGMHPNAQIAAEASMAAHEQGKFWEMHDKMFENRTALTRPDLERYAEQLGLNLAKFKAALDSGKYKAKVAQDSAAGNQVGAGGTPTFFINGRKHVGGGPFQLFKTMIDEEMAKADKLIAAGVKPDALYQKVIEQNISVAAAGPR